MDEDRASRHPRPDELQAFALGLLDGPELGPIARHVETCAVCARRLERVPGDRLVSLLNRAAPLLIVGGLLGGVAGCSREPEPLRLNDPARTKQVFQQRTEDPRVPPGATVKSFATSRRRAKSG
jgi:anti-sigma factor RsiW